MPTNRRQFIYFLAGATAAIPFHAATARSRAVTWHDVREWGVEGKGWTDTKRYFDRLPSKAEGLVREPVWNLSRTATGMTVRFMTDATEIIVRYSLLSEQLAMSHMPATGVSGLDLYATDGRGMERWAGVVLPDKQHIERPIASGLAPGMRQYAVYLPLRNGVESLEIGFEEGATVMPIAPRTERPMVFYGTSIMHGACASRPGMAISAILGRRLRRPVINLGFAGNGRMEPEVGELLSELDPCVYAIDCLPNMNQEMIEERAAPLVRQLRAARPDTPVLLVEDRSFTNTRFFPAREERHRTNRQALRRAFRQLQDEGMGHLFYLDGEQLLGDDGESATDGSHPSDLGMVRYADAYEPALRSILGQY